MTAPAQAAAVSLDVERVESLGNVVLSSAQTVGALVYWTMSPTTSTGDTFAGLASCVAPATATTARLATRLGICAHSVALTVASLRSSDLNGAAQLRARH